MAPVCYFCPSLHRGFYFGLLITFTTLPACAVCDKVTRYRASSSVCGDDHTSLPLSRRFIKTHWTNTQNTNKKMTIHFCFFIQMLYSTNMGTMNTAWSWLSVNASSTTAPPSPPKWTVKRFTCFAFAAAKVPFLRVFCSFWSHVNKHVHTLLTYL